MTSLSLLLLGLTLGARPVAPAMDGARSDTALLRRDTSTAQTAGTLATDTSVSRAMLGAPLADTVRRRPRAVEVSDAYEQRLRIHRYASYTMLPLFALQTVAGNQLYQADLSGAPRPGWASAVHGAGAAGLGALFTVNTVTGVWNLWDSRGNETGRTRRWVHSLLMLGSDAGFTWSGIKLASDAKNSQSGRDRHRRVAYISMGASLLGDGIMLIGNR
jgi:hypothetical protein